MTNDPLRHVPANSEVLEATSLLGEDSAVVHLALASVVFRLQVGRVTLEELWKRAPAGRLKCRNTHGDRFEALDEFAAGGKESPLGFEHREKPRLAFGKGLASKLGCGLAKSQKLVPVQASSVCCEGVLFEGAAPDSLIM